MDIFKNYQLKILVLFILSIVLYLFFQIEDGFENVMNETDFNIKKYTFGDYEIIEIFNLLTPEECKRLIDITKNQGLEESEILSYEKTKDTKLDVSYRKSKQAWLKDDYDPILTKFANFSQKITGLPIKNQEETQVVVYQPGGEFKEHYDSCIHDKDYCDKINRHAGQRRSTILVYLNDDYIGGETEFIELGLKIKPETGKGILFWSTDENEQLLPKSKHKANVLQSGEKWIATKWSHIKEFI